jgi:hypothetical protein
MHRIFQPDCKKCCRWVALMFDQPAGEPGDAKEVK